MITPATSTQHLYEGSGTERAAERLALSNSIAPLDRQLHKLPNDVTEHQFSTSWSSYAEVSLDGSSSSRQILHSGTRSLVLHTLNQMQMSE